MVQRVMFEGTDADSHPGVWITDGTNEGTLELQVSANDSHHGLYYPVYYFYIPNGFTSYKGKVLFFGDDVNGGTGLSVTDGTAAGTSELQVSGASSGGLNPFGFMPYNGKMLFEGIDANNNEGLWVTDGTAAGTSELQVSVEDGQFGLYTPSYYLYFRTGFMPYNGSVTYNGKLLFAAENADEHAGLWITNGTGEGTSELKVSGGSTGLNPFGFTLYNGKVLFQGLNANDDEGLWVTDGTAAGTSELQVGGASSSGLNPRGLTPYGGKLLFAGDGANDHPGLWVTDGTAAGTSELQVSTAAALASILMASFPITERCYSRATTRTAITAFGLQTVRPPAPRSCRSGTQAATSPRATLPS